MSPTSDALAASQIQTMQAVVQRGYGDAEVLDVAQIPVPQPGPGEVLIRVEAAAIDRGTWHLMTGTPKVVRVALGWRTPRRQLVVGRDVAGAVVAVGEGVTRFAVGDRVFGCAQGSLAQYAVALEVKLAHQPPGVAPSEAAVLGISGLTALQALDAARVGAADRVLVVGASGGVGAFAVQLAAARGAVVTGVCSAAKADAVRDWGAAHVVDHATADPLAGDERYEAVLVLAGDAPLERLRGSLTPAGSLVFVGSEGGGAWTGGYGRPMRWALRMLPAKQRFVMLSSREKAPGDLQRLARAVSDGQLRPPVHAVFPLDATRAAMHELEAGQVVGKVAISVAATS